MGSMGNVRFHSGLVWNTHDAGVRKEMSEFKLSRRSLDRLQGVDDRLVAVVKHAITVTKKPGKKIISITHANIQNMIWPECSRQSKVKFELQRELFEIVVCRTRVVLGKSVAP